MGQGFSPEEGPEEDPGGGISCGVEEPEGTNTPWQEEQVADWPGRASNPAPQKGQFTAGDMARILSRQ
jgi:hypothetical protein